MLVAIPNHEAHTGSAGPLTPAIRTPGQFVAARAKAAALAAKGAEREHADAIQDALDESPFHIVNGKVRPKGFIPRIVS